ncbi:hypothetical protein SUGI_1123320 [Cryptomeria japonica]|nr:hypothetical protein SUGI_1123320 [Cryptomeria japonica]
MAPGNKLDLDPKWTMTMDLDLLVYVGFIMGLPLNMMGELKLSIGIDLTNCWDELSRVSAAYTLFFTVAPPSSDRDSYVATIPGADVIDPVVGLESVNDPPEAPVSVASVYPVVSIGYESTRKGSKANNKGRQGKGRASNC